MFVDRLPFSFDPLIAEAKRRARYRRIAGAALLAIALAAAAAMFALRSLAPPGASGHGSNDGRPAAHSGRGAIVGSIQWEGGIFHHFGQKFGGVVTVYNASGHRIRRVTVRASHDFQLRLAPGWYHLGYPENPHALSSCESPTIAIRSGRITHQNLLLGCGYY